MPSSDGTPVVTGLALSGGGFRATLFHLGVIEHLRDASLLNGITEISSVSGGSIVAAHLVLNWQACTVARQNFLTLETKFCAL
jgi:predicted acylesterase/phospholipase RssA